MIQWKSDGALVGGITLALLLCLPLGGVLARSMPLAPYLEFPPATRHVDHAAFSWPAFIFVSVVIVVFCLPFAAPLVRGLVRGTPGPERSSIPWWGWLGVAVIAASWLVAWSRWPSFEALHDYSFLGLWSGYIVTANAATVMRVGHCVLLDRPRFFAGLFPLSAVFWWCLEYLNRYVQNWAYVNVEDVGPAEYALKASLSFATVLPAVVSTSGLLKTFPNVLEPFARFFMLRLARPKRWAWAGLICGATILTAIGIAPNFLFPFVWIAPLGIIVSLQTLCGAETLFSPLRQGDWRPVVCPALAALICGFFWEMWNSYSLVHWEYRVPFVDRFEVFEMPMLGYAGYLPFGLECAAVVGLLRGGLSCFRFGMAPFSQASGS